MKNKSLLLLTVLFITLALSFLLRRQQQQLTPVNAYYQTISRLDQDNLTLIKINDFDLTQDQVDAQLVSQMLEVILVTDPQAAQLISEKSLNQSESKLQLDDALIWIGDTDYQGWYVRLDGQDNIYLLDNPNYFSLPLEESDWLTEVGD